MMRDLLDFAVEHYGPQIAKALQVGGDLYSVDDVVAAVRVGKMQAWFGERSVTFTQVEEYPQARVLQVFLGAGDRLDYDEMAPKLEAFATEQRCDRIRLEGRLGWVGVLPSRDGWEKIGVVMHKRVGG